MVIEGLKIIKAPYQKIIERSLLDKFNLQNPNRFLPIFTIYDFLKSTDKYFESKDTPPSFFENMRLCNLGTTGKFMFSSSKLLPALQNLVKYDKYLCTNQSTELQIDGSSTSIKNSFSDATSKGGPIMEYVWLCMLKNLLTNVNNNIWDPIEIHFMNEESLFSKHYLNKDTFVKYNQEQTAIVFNSSLLTNKILNSNNCIDDYVTNKGLLQRPAVELSRKIEHFLDNNLSGYLPTLQVMSDLFGVSPATFKRHLGYENTNYKDITSRWRLSTSVSLLANTNNSITEISDKLHYSNPGNFIRAFRNWTGQTPMAFKGSP